MDDKVDDKEKKNSRALIYISLSLNCVSQQDKHR